MLTKIPPSPPGLDWAHRLVSWEMPAGTGGEPAFVRQRSEVNLALKTTEVAIVFGFRDADRMPAPGVSREQTMVNYFAVQIDIAP